MPSERRRNELSNGYDGAALSLADQLADPSETAYRGALARLASGSVEHSRSGDLLVEIVQRLANAAGLTERARADRLRNVLRRLPPRPEQMDPLVALARECPAGVRITLAEFIPPMKRPLLTNAAEGAGGTVSTAAPIMATASADSGTQATSSAVSALDLPRTIAVGESGDAVVSDAFPGSLSDAVRRSATSGKGDVRRIGPEQPVPSRAFGVVAILSRMQHQESNKVLLRSAEFEPLIWDSVEKLRAELSTSADVCACIVDGSVLRDLDEAAQRELFEFLGEYSSFLWIRIDESALRIARTEVRGIVRRVRCARVEPSNVVFMATPDLTAAELDDVEAANQALRAYGTASIVPGELDEDRTQLLVAAARQHALSRSLDGPVHVQVIETHLLAGGRSGALIARIRVDRDGEHIVAKIDTKEAILREARRFVTFVQRWDDALRPETFLHSRAGVILFALVGSEDDGARPADTLESRLDELWIAEVHNLPTEPSLSRWRDELVRGIGHACQALGRMNRRRPPVEAPFAPHGDPYTTPLDRLAATGVTWGFEDGEESAAEARRRAQARLARLAGQSVIHGDLNLRNILLRGDRDAHLIDYAACGPGHPSVDLARLEVALFTTRVRQLASEARCREYQRMLTLGDETREELAAAFPELHACAMNQVALAGCERARREALEVVRAFGGDREDYIAAKYLVASQALVITGCATSMARAIVSALIPEILSWSVVIETGAGAQSTLGAEDRIPAVSPS